MRGSGLHTPPMQIVDRCPSCVQAVIEDVHLLHWRSAIDAEGLDRSLRVSRELAQKYPRGIYALNVVHGGLSVPSLALQRRATEVSEATAKHVLATVVVLPGEGFWVGAARAFLTTLNTMSPMRARRLVASDVEQGAKAIAQVAQRDAAWASYVARFAKAATATADAAPTERTSRAV